jgi:hypothetical protein
VKTEKGASKVIARKHWNVVLDENSVPYKVAEGMLVSPNHKVKQDGKVFNARDIGVKLETEGTHIDYFHIQTEHWLTDFIPLSESLSVEVWDGYEWGDAKQMESFLWLQDKKSKSLAKYAKV